MVAAMENPKHAANQKIVVIFRGKVLFLICIFVVIQIYLLLIYKTGRTPELESRGGL